MSALPLLIAIVEQLAIPYLQDIITPIAALLQNVPQNHQERITLPLDLVFGHATLRITGTGLHVRTVNHVQQDKSNRTAEVHQQERAFRVTSLRMHTSLLDAITLTVLAVE